MFFQGFKMGFIVGGIFGGLTGVYYAVQYRTFYYIPLAAVSSGASFGFFMGVGMIMRNEMKGSDEDFKEEYLIKQFNPITKEVEYEPLYSKYQQL